MPPPLSERGPEIVKLVRAAKECIGCPSKKFAGAAAIEILREELRGEGIPTSDRDVYVKGFSAEIDLIIPRRSANPKWGLLYEPGEVAVALEVKKTGSYGESGRDKIRDDFARLRDLRVTCAYITFEDRKSYRWRPTEAHLNVPCFALAWHEKTDGALLASEEGEDWTAFLRFLREHV